MTNGGPPILAPGAPLAPGYEVIEHLSRGNALDVYDAWSVERDCRCVAKALRPDRAGDAGPRRRLLVEGRVLAALTHPHLVRAYELVRRPAPVLILETLEGETLDHLIAHRRARLPAGELAHLGLQLCSAIGYLHRHGWLHLDLKPSNIVAEAGLAKVIDLSVARRPGRAHAGIGTPQYMAPEQARGGRLSEAADVWGLGAVLFEAASAQRPFSASGDGEYEQLERRLAAIRGLRRLPQGLAALIDACLEPAADDRPAVAELAAALTPFAPGAPRPVDGSSAPPGARGAEGLSAAAV
jgi:eukaryotic-like serine/threonine-protein kinase